MPNKENQLFVPLPNPSKKEVMKKYTEEYHQDIALRKKSKCLKIKNPERKKEESRFDYSKTFEYKAHHWVFTPLGFDGKNIIKEKIKQIETKIKEIAEIKVSSIEMLLFRKDIIDLIKAIFPKRCLLIENPKEDSMYYPKKLLETKKIYLEETYEYFLEKFVQQFYNYSLGNFEGYVGWRASNKNKLITKTLKMIDQLKWRI